MARAASSTAYFQIAFADGTFVDEDAYRMARAPAPTVSRKVGTLVGGREVVAGYADPVWKFEVEVGPLTPSESAALRANVGSPVTITFHDPDRPLDRYSRKEVWQNSSFAADLLDAKPRPVGADITQGDRWRVRFQALESAFAVAAPLVPSGQQGPGAAPLPATETRAGIVELATESEMNLGAVNRVPTAKRVKDYVDANAGGSGTAATEAAPGVVELATEGEMNAGDANRVPTSKRVKDYVDSQATPDATESAAGKVELATEAEMTARADNRVPTALRVGEFVDAALRMGAGGGTFLSQTDTPNAFTGEGGKTLRVNTAADAVEFGYALRVLTQAEYDAISVKNNNTLYFIREG